MRRRNRRRRSRRRFDRPLKASIAELTGWQPPTISRLLQPKPSLANPTARTRKILSMFPKVAASIGFAVAAFPDAAVEVLPGSPTTIVFTAGNKLRGLVVLPTNEVDIRRVLGIPDLSAQDEETDRLWEEERKEEKSCELIAAFSTMP